MSSIADRTESGSYLGLLITAGSLFLLPMVVPAPTPFFLILGAFGFWITVVYGGSYVYKLFGGLMLGIVAVTYLVGLGEPTSDLVHPTDAATVDTATIDRSLTEPVQMPVALGFMPVMELWSDSIHVYQSTAPKNAKQGRRTQARAMAYYEDELSSDWNIVRSQNGLLVVKDPDSAQGIAVYTSSGGDKHAAVVTLEIHSLYCDANDHCS
jgi:hypothetical protein